MNIKISKKIIVLLFLLLSNIIFAENPFIGKWSIETLVTPGKLIWTIEDGIINQEITDGNITTNGFVYNEEMKTVSIIDEEEVISFNYIEYNNIIDLTLLNIEDSPLYYDIVEIPQSLRGINNLTDEFANYFEEFLIKLFERSPIFRMERIEQ